MTTTILAKLCWAAVQFLEAHVVHPSPQFEGQIPEICKLLISLFPAVELHYPEDNLGAIQSSYRALTSDHSPVRALIVEALVLAPSNIISSTLGKVFQNKEAQFISKLDSGKSPRTNSLVFILSDYILVMQICVRCNAHAAICHAPA